MAKAMRTGAVLLLLSYFLTTTVLTFPLQPLEQGIAPSASPPSPPSSPPAAGAFLSTLEDLLPWLLFPSPPCFVVRRVNSGGGAGGGGGVNIMVMMMLMMMSIHKNREGP